MCDYSGIDNVQRYTKEELTPEEIEHHIRIIIKVGRDEELKLKIPMFENSSCPEVIYSLFCHYHFFVEFVPYSLSYRSPHFPLQSLAPLSAIRGPRSL
jgi:hypothetical protein